MLTEVNTVIINEKLSPLCTEPAQEITALPSSMTTRAH